MHIRMLRRTLAAILTLAVAALALACGGAAESAPAAPAASVAQDYYTTDSVRNQSGPAGPAGLAGAPGPAGAGGAERSRRQLPYSGAAAAATAAPAATPALAAAAAVLKEVESAAARPQQPRVSDSPQPQSARQLIVESWISVEVTNIDATVRQVETLAAQSGGWVESSEVFGEAGYRSATVRIRVPADRLSNGLDSLRAMGRVTDEGVSSTDVTERLIDNQARLTAWYAQEKRLVTLLENAPTVEDIIQIERRIAEVRFDIEHVEATQRDLTGRVATSLITVNLRLPAQYAADPPVGNLELATGDPSAVADAIVARVSALDGYVGQKRSYDAGGGRAVDLIVFVKPADLAPLMDYAGTLGVPSGRQLTSVGPAPLNEVPNARFTLAIRSDVDLRASMSLHAPDPIGVAEQVRAHAESRGGLVDNWSEFQDEDEHRVRMELMVNASELRSVMDFAAGLGKLQHWDYNAVGQNPSADAPNARLNFSVETPASNVEFWILLAVIAGAVALVAIVVVAVALGRRRGRNRRNEAHPVADLEPVAEEQ